MHGQQCAPTSSISPLLFASPGATPWLGWCSTRAAGGAGQHWPCATRCPGAPQGPHSLLAQAEGLSPKRNGERACRGRPLRACALTGVGAVGVAWPNHPWHGQCPESRGSGWASQPWEPGLIPSAQSAPVANGAQRHRGSRWRREQATMPWSGHREFTRQDGKGPAGCVSVPRQWARGLASHAAALPASSKSNVCRDVGWGSGWFNKGKQDPRWPLILAR